MQEWSGACQRFCNDDDHRDRWVKSKPAIHESHFSLHYDECESWGKQPLPLKMSTLIQNHIFTVHWPLRLKPQENWGGPSLPISVHKATLAGSHHFSRLANHRQSCQVSRIVSQTNQIIFDMMEVKWLWTRQKSEVDSFPSQLCVIRIKYRYSGVQDLICSVIRSVSNMFVCNRTLYDYAGIGK